MTGSGEEKAHSLHQIALSVAASVANDAARGSTTLRSHVEVSDRNSSHAKTAGPRPRPLRKKHRIGDPCRSLPPHRRCVARPRIQVKDGDRISVKMWQMSGRRGTPRCPTTRRRRRRSGRLAASLSPPFLSGRIVEIQPRLGGSFTMDDLVLERGDRVVEIVVMAAQHLSQRRSLRTTQTGGPDPGRFSLPVGL